MQTEYQVVIGTDSDMVNLSKYMDGGLAFDWPVNSGVQSGQFSLKADIFDFEPEELMQRKVRVYRYDCHNPSGCIVFSGILNGWNAYCKPSSTGITLNAMGNMGMLKRVRGTNRNVSSQVMRDIKYDIQDIFLQYQSADGGCLQQLCPITLGDMQEVGIDYRYQDGDYFRNGYGYFFPLVVLNNLMQYIENSHFWRLGPDGVVELKPYSAQPNHHLVFGKHIKEIESTIDQTERANVVNFLWGSSTTFGVYEDEQDRLKNCSKEMILDYSGLAYNSALQKAIQQLENSKGGTRSATISVADNYNVCSIKPGDTVAVAGLPFGQNAFDDVMQVTKVQYRSDGVYLEINQSAQTIVDVLNKNFIRDEYA